MKKGLIIIGIIITLVVGSVFGLRYYLLKKAEFASAQMQERFGPPTVELTKGDVNRIVFASGSVKERKRKEIDGEVNEKVTKILVQKGQEVKAGDILFVLDNEEVNLALERERLNYRLKQREYEKELNTISGSKIKANKSGTIKEILVKEGQEVNEDTIVATVTNQDILTVVVPFNSAITNQLSVGQKGQFFLNDFLQYVDGKITKIDKKGQATTGGGIVHNVTFEIVNPGALAPGLEGHLEFVTDEGQTVRSMDTIKIREPEVQDIKAGIKGNITQILVDEGDVITKGELFAVVDNSDVLLDFEDKKLALEQAKLALKTQEKEANKYIVTAPIAGVISEINVEVGEKCPENKPDIIMAGSEGLVLKVNVDETDIGTLAIGQKATVYLTAFGEKQFSGEIVDIDEMGSQDNGSVAFEAEILLSGTEQVKVGMTGESEIIIARKENVLRAPINAVEITSEGIGNLMVVKNEGEAPEPAEIKLGLEGDDFIEILEGVKEGTKIVAQF